MCVFGGNMPTRVMNKNGVDEIASGDQRFFLGKKVVFDDVSKGEGGEKGLVKDSCIIKRSKPCSDSEESSSIGKNSDLSENSMEKKSGDGEEVQSSYKGPLDAMEALEQVLPIRRGISRFYNGKSKSFASLAEASSSLSSMKDLSKAENAYMRKRRNLLACNLNWDKSRSRGNRGGAMSKRVTNSSRTTLALAVAMNNSENEKQVVECKPARSPLLSVSPSLRKDFSTWRSFSLADLQQCVSVTCSNSNQGDTKPC